LLLFLELKAQYAGKKIKISSELYKKGCVSNPEEGLLAAQKIGFPVMIKASEGGGGKGIRKVEAPEEFASSFRQVCEWQNKNGQDNVFDFKLVSYVQILCCQMEFLDLQYGRQALPEIRKHLGMFRFSYNFRFIGFVL
jgi:acetyl-CoA carboxylase/biotin carboxylase 1